MRRLAAIVLVVVVWSAVLPDPALGEVKYPRLSGTIVDKARVLSSSDRSRIGRLLKAHEKATTNEIVVVTVTSLQGVSIKKFSRGLAEHWNVGAKDKNNGVLLVVAPEQRKVRIQVGKGLRKTLTDSIAKDIINSRILPSFKEGDMDAGIADGAAAIVEALEGEYESKGTSSNIWKWVAMPIMVVFSLFGRGRYGRRYGGGFSSGGGGSSGGGASGGW